MEYSTKREVADDCVVSFVMNGNNKATWIRFTFFISLGVERRAFTSRSSGCLMFWVITSSLATGILITMPAFTPFFSSGLSLKSSTLEISNFRQIRYMVSFFCMVYSISGRSSQE